MTLNIHGDFWYPLLGFFRATYSLGIIVSIAAVVALWMLFMKAKENGWAAIIPFYNTYVLFKITWGSGWYFLLLLIPVANVVIHIITMCKLAKAFGKGGGWACGLIFLYPIFLCIMAFDNSIQYVGEFAGNVEYDTASAQKQTYTGTTGAKFCPYCGAPVNPGDKFCEKCGHQL